MIGLRAAWPVLAVWVGMCCACSVLVDPSVLSIKCEVVPGMAGEDPCLAAGMHCLSSECRPCEKNDAGEGNADICNGVDDDCDGYVDEGHDEDNDGFTWCGGGHPELRDCVPDDPTIHPAGQAGPDLGPISAPKEACDGKDNDCDGTVDEDSGCSSTRTSCSVDSDCSGGQRCDTATRICIEPRSVGSGCTDDSQCAGGFCLKRGQYELDVELSGDRCASACCADADCGAGFVCVAANSGVRVCLPANVAARGSRSIGGTCTSDTECNSGACVGGRCAQPCSADAVCEGAVCSLSLGGIREARRWSCVGDDGLLGREDSGSACSGLDPTACRSGLCVDGSCSSACGRDADCAPREVCSVDTVRALFGPVSTISFCVPRGLGDTGSRLCCTNTDCGADTLCAPVSADGRTWMMGCQ